MLWQSSREIHYSCGEMPYMHSLNLAIISIRYRSLWLFLSTASIPRRIFFHAFLSLLLKIRRSVPNDNTVVSEESRRTYDLGPCIYSWAVFFVVGRDRHFSCHVSCLFIFPSLSTVISPSCISLPLLDTGEKALAWVSTMSRPNRPDLCLARF